MDSLPKTRAEAKLKGIKFYFTGKPCKHGHIADRRTHNGECKVCNIISDNKRKEIHKETLYKKYRAWYHKNRESCLAKMNKWQHENREWFNTYEKNKRSTNIEHRLTKSLRDRLYKAIVRGYKFKSALHLVGCSVKELKTYLENKFTDGMTWDNYGLWHIDHIKPCVSFDLSIKEEQEKCFHYSNLQPLWAVDNFKKGKKI